MGLSFLKTIKLGSRTSVNVSKTGVSASRRFGPVTIDSRSMVSVRLGKGTTWRL